MISQNEMIQILCRAYPGFRNKIVESADSWIDDDGRILLYPMMGELCNLIISRLRDGDYSYVDDLFSVIEQLLIDGSEETKGAIAAGFLEGMQCQTEIDRKYWSPLIGSKAAEHCQAMDKFYGISAEGLIKKT
jgi:hypothetical protein